MNTLTSSLLELYNKDAKDNLTLSEITDYKIDKFVKPDWQDNIHLYFTDELLWNNIDTVQDSQKYTKKLIENGHEIHIVTSSHLYDMPTKYKWLKRKFPFLDKKNIITIRDKDKKLLKLDVLVDDCYSNFIGGGDYKKILLDYPWNQSTADSVYGIIRCKNWEEIYNVISHTYKHIEVWEDKKDK